MSDTTSPPALPQPPVLNSAADLRELIRLLSGRALDMGLQTMTVLPDIYNFVARGPEYFADRYLPPAVAGALNDARQYVETAPGVRRHLYEQIAPQVAQGTGLFQYNPYSGGLLTSLLANAQGSPQPMPAQPPVPYQQQPFQAAFPAAPATPDLFWNPNNKGQF
jgi:hypothetical protein